MSDNVLLEIVKNVGAWLTGLTALIAAFGTAWIGLAAFVSALASAWAVVRAGRATKKAAAQEIELTTQKETTEAQASTICNLQDETCRAQALAIHAAAEMVKAREETRKLHEWIETDAFNAGVLSPLATSGRPPLEPLTDPAPLEKDS